MIGAAASTSYRVFAQTNGTSMTSPRPFTRRSGTPSYQLGQSTPGWLDNEVSTLSSSGVTEDRQSAGHHRARRSELGRLLDRHHDLYRVREPVGGSDIGLEVFGGTSESTPLTAGVAALVIQAYRESHGGQHADAGRRPADPLQQRDRPRRRRRGAGLGAAQRAAGRAAGQVVRQARVEDRRPAAFAGLRSRTSASPERRSATRSRSPTPRPARRRSRRCCARSARRRRSPAARSTCSWRARGRRDPAPATRPPSTSPARRSRSWPARRSRSRRTWTSSTRGSAGSRCSRAPAAPPVSPPSARS